MDSGRSSGPTSGSGPAPILSANDGNEVLKQLRRTHKKVETMEEALQSRLSVVANEVSDSEPAIKKIVITSYPSRSKSLEKNMRRVARGSKAYR